MGTTNLFLSISISLSVYLSIYLSLPLPFSGVISLSLSLRGMEISQPLSLFISYTKQPQTSALSALTCRLPSCLCPTPPVNDALHLIGRKGRGMGAEMAVSLSYCSLPPQLLPTPSSACFFLRRASQVDFLVRSGGRRGLENNHVTSGLDSDVCTFAL